MSQEFTEGTPHGREEHKYPIKQVTKLHDSRILSPSHSPQNCSLGRGLPGEEGKAIGYVFWATIQSCKSYELVLVSAVIP